MHALLEEESSTSFIAHYGVLDDFVPNWGNLEMLSLFIYFLFTVHD